MLITKRYFKKSIGFIIAVIMIIAGVTVFSKEVYADSYKISTEVDGYLEVQYTLKYSFWEHYIPDSSWRCDNWPASATKSFQVPVKVKITRDIYGKATYSMFFNETSNWRLECFAYAPGMKPDQGSYMIFEGNAVFNFTDSGEDDLSSIYYGEASDKEVDLTSKGCEFNVTNFYDDNPDWQVDRYIEKIKRVDKITLKFTYPEIAERNYTLTFDWDSGVSGVTGHNNDEKDIDISKNTAYSYTYGKTEPTFIFFNDGYEFDYVEETTQDHKQNHS